MNSYGEPIHGIIYGELIPMYYKMLSYHSSLDKLVEAKSLSYGELVNIRSYFEGEEEFNDVILDLYYFRVIESVWDIRFISIEEFEDYCECVKGVENRIKGFSGVYQRIRRCVSVSLLKCQHLEELLRFLRGVKYLMTFQWAHGDFLIDQFELKIIVLITKAIGSNMYRLYEFVSICGQLNELLELNREIKKTMILFSVSCLNKEVLDRGKIIENLLVMVQDDEELTGLLNRYQITQEKPPILKKIHTSRNLKNQRIIDKDCIYRNTRSKVTNTVYKARMQENSTIREVAIKEYTASSLSALHSITVKESSVIKAIRGKSKHFLENYDTYLQKNQDTYTYGIIMEYCEKTLSDECTERIENNRPFTESELLEVIYGLTEAFSFLHHHSIYHGDIKPRNILVGKDNLLKITDFNLVTNKKYNTSVQGSPGYMAPEIQEAYDKHAKNQDFTLRYRSSKADVYSLGLLFLQISSLYSVRNLNTHKQQGELLRDIARLPYDWLRRLLTRMLDYDYTTRYSMKRLLGFIPTNSTRTS